MLPCEADDELDGRGNIDMESMIIWKSRKEGVVLAFIEMAIGRGAELELMTTIDEIVDKWWISFAKKWTKASLF